MKSNNTITILLFVLVFFCRAQAQEKKPVIAFTGFNSSNPDGFCFVAIENIPAGTTIFFTDKGWTADDSFRTGEGIIEWTSPASELSAGTVVTLFKADSWETSLGSLTGSVTLAASADQILAYTNTAAAPLFLAAVTFSSTNGWDEDAVETYESALPAGLKDDSTALALPASDNSIYAGTFTGTTAEVLQKINNPANWYGSDNYRFNLEGESFPVAVLTGSGDWHDAPNWKTGMLPGADVSVIVAENRDIKVSASGAECNNLYIESRGTVLIQESGSLTINGNLTLHSRTSSYAAAIIAEGNLSIAGTTTYDRYLPSYDWHLVASPVSGQAMNSFVQSNPVEYYEQEDNFDLAPYNEASDSWSPYTSLSNTNLLTPGAGYSLRLKDDGIVQFTGTLNLSDVQVQITRNNYGWNCVGNPFASAIQGTGAGSFLSANAGYLDENYTGLYVWDNQVNDYLVYVHSDNATIAPCQGFIIRAANGGETVSINGAMQVFASPSFKSEEVPWPQIILTASAGSKKNSTRFVFNGEMTAGLDPGYDAGKLKGNPDFAIYSRLMKGSEDDFAVQALPYTNHEQFRIPIGIDCSEGGDITFEATATDLPSDMQVVLEDTQTNRFIRLDNPAAKYTVTIGSGSSERDRFYLRTVQPDATGTSEIPFNINISQRGNTIVLHGIPAPGATVSLISLSGRKYIAETTHSDELKISTYGLPSGIYIIEVISENGHITRKIPITQKR